MRPARGGAACARRAPAPAGCRAVRGQHARGVVSFPTHLAREGRMTVTIGRRELLAALGGAVAAWPRAARAQQGERMRRIGVLLPAAANDAEFQARMGAFQQGLQKAGWSIGRNVQLDIRWATHDAAKIRQQTTELVALAPDVILASSSPTLAPLLQATRTIPIVFTAVADPVGAGFVENLARPGGNATGFLVFEYSIAGK